MNRYLLIRRLRGPLFLLLLGVIALLSQLHLIHWSHSWPLILIYFGVFMLAERAALATDGYPYAGGCDVHPDDAAPASAVSSDETSGASENLSTHSSKGVQL